MPFSLAIAIIIVADVALIAGLAFVMSRASLLTPHASSRHDADTAATVAATPIHRAPPRASRRPRASVA
jgi:hypothetical protein